MMLRKKGVLILTIIVVMLMSSCQKRFFPNLMFKEEKSQIINDSSLIHSPIKEYVLQKGDKISFKIFSNGGFVLIDQGLKDIGVDNTGATEDIVYTIDKKGFVRLPIIDSVKLVGMSVPDAERFLEKQYANIIQNPFVTLSVESWRVFLFKGLNGTASVLPIEHQNTTLLEIIAQSGGIPSDSRAYRIKVIRGDIEDPEVYIVDVSSLQGLKETNIQILSNDIIYIEPSTKLSNGLVTELSPYFSLLTIILLFANLINGR